MDDGGEWVFQQGHRVFYVQFFDESEYVLFYAHAQAALVGYVSWRLDHHGAKDGVNTADDGLHERRASEYKLVPPEVVDRHLRLSDVVLVGAQVVDLRVQAQPPVVEDFPRFHSGVTVDSHYLLDGLVSNNRFTSPILVGFDGLDNQVYEVELVLDLGIL